MSRVIFDNECREYKEGWNACNSGKLRLANPYSCLAYDGELYRLWQKGWDDCQHQWDSPDSRQPESFDFVNTSFSITDQEPNPDF